MATQLCTASHGPITPPATTSPPLLGEEATETVDFMTVVGSTPTKFNVQLNAVKVRAVLVIVAEAAVKAVKAATAAAAAVTAVKAGAAAEAVVAAAAVAKAVKVMEPAAEAVVVVHQDLSDGDARQITTAVIQCAVKRKALQII